MYQTKKKVVLSDFLQRYREDTTDLTFISHTVFNIFFQGELTIQVLDYFTQLLNFWEFSSTKSRLREVSRREVVSDSKELLSIVIDHT